MKYNKFTYGYAIILFAVNTTNSIGIDINKRFGCHNLSSVNKMAAMNGNEIFRNLLQCMRDSGTYTEKNLDTAKKIQNDFESAQKDSLPDILYRETLGLGALVSLVTLTGSGLVLLYSLFNGNAVKVSKKNLAFLTVGGLGGTYLFMGLGDRFDHNMIEHEEERKKALAINIPKVVEIMKTRQQ